MFVLTCLHVMNKSDRHALLFLFFAFIGVWSAILIYDHFIDHSSRRTLTEAVAIDALEPHLADSTSSPGRYDAIPQFKNYPPHRFAQPTEPCMTFPFDPNTADSTTLLRLGLPAWMVRNIYKYRAKGGRYHEASDFKRTYGMTGELWKRLGPMIRIGDDFRYLTSEQARRGRSSDSAAADTSRRRGPALSYPKKYEQVMQLDINAIDTSELRRIPGIGPVYARRIVRYREQLGGFATLSQLSEIPDLPAGIEAWFAPPTGVTRTINLNTADFNTLRRHPYMSYEKANAIATYRRIHGPIKNLDELQLMPEFTETDFKRLAPYVRF